MFIISTGITSGVNPFFPAVTRGRRGELIVFEWDRYRRHAYFLLALNCALIGMAVVLVFAFLMPITLTVLAVLAIGVIATRFWLTKTKRVSLKQAVSIMPAPMLAWLEHWSHFVAILLVVYGASIVGEGWIRAGAIILIALLTIMIVVPILNLIVGKVIGIERQP